ncbi:lantibiotic dehydratase C-terminal domain-containing protein [Arthrobacter burdickii]|uniref:Lantibiotic dehydratase C-terminal domain-containing protein n=1 Tax=Arthrobacter burdickii TaxID=3035920 RepID=A0ABT8JZV5_9MICC|nr:lantibiotic dehydratase C-terminal domain-containing protein [Arthrobacter burdickii]MDN4610096.1 lantibiotic dehydratase C-terminal domain-containing protein [Arthrobacter burdickii]
MSQLTAVRTASRMVVSTQWWHLSLSTGGFDVADGIIEELVTPLVAQAQALGAKRWYFTRMDDAPTGQVRLSIHAHPRVLERLQAFQRALQASSGGKFPLLAVRQQFTAPVSNTYYSGGQEMADPQLEADLVKYGGVEGLHLAEEVFELSSELALWATARFPRMQSRSALGALLLFDAADSMMRGPHSATWPDRHRLSWDAYWDGHLRTCTADVGPRASGVREAMTLRVATKSTGFHALMAATAAESTVHNWRRRWVRSLDTYLYRADKVHVSRSAQHLTVYQAHMALNRLGFVAREEAALGLYARTWQPQTELARPRTAPSARRNLSSERTAP